LLIKQLLTEHPPCARDAQLEGQSCLLSGSHDAIRVTKHKLANPCTRQAGGGQHIVH